ncbi:MULTISPECIES: aconitase/3-isopropylmalate dehydratase large subunit family protein [unclassified Achromobacter]|uniref:3-isopropylmalate dehydratase large subunit n=1 Tax=unclassified Achromobacter TaxID=2626865 RepID=UPI000B51B82C|nr:MULTISPECIES: aconitase/3-isopropylmalate dehydratase large subunit family protein [unclassified Achromobacter]OWT77087.1 3-isopropylmalate dehydratase [Achromobacter sp. HZ28]OWT77968.1 3-isopropylmalate dehydratase [Achromobacter sp. HZ34]
MGMTMLEKLLARAAGKAKVSAGDIVTVKVDQAVLLDSTFTIPGRFPFPEKVWDPDRIALVFDHTIPAPNITIANGLKNGRNFAARYGIKFYGEGRQGISHQLMAELGMARPGSVLMCSDSHTCASGAFNCAARGVGSEELLYVVCTGRTWFIVYPTIRYELKGKLRPGVYPRDIIHYIAGKYGDHVGHNVEYAGPAVRGIDMSGRQTMSTMSAELSAEFALFEADEVTAAYLAGRTTEPWEPVFADEDAEYAEVRDIDLDEVEPLIVMPHFVPGNVKPVSEVKGLKIDQAFIGSCANARIEDLRIAATVLRGRHVHPDVRMIITPSSSDVMKQASKEGLIEIFIEAGALVTNATCGACLGGSMGVVGDGERCLTSSTRNFKGRMGSPNSEVLMGSPATVAASAIAGSIADPREYAPLELEPA